MNIFYFWSRKCILHESIYKYQSNWQIKSSVFYLQHYSFSRELTILGLFLVALGTGGIKPCVSAFGGDQFKIPQQATQLATFFSLFYFAINAGSLISTFLTPVLRMDVKCFDQEDCYSLAFGVPGVLMVVSICKQNLIDTK